MTEGKTEGPMTVYYYILI